MSDIVDTFETEGGPWGAVRLDLSRNGNMDITFVGSGQDWTLSAERAKQLAEALRNYADGKYFNGTQKATRQEASEMFAMYFTGSGHHGYGLIDLFTPYGFVQGISNNVIREVAEWIQTLPEKEEL